MSNSADCLQSRRISGQKSVRTSDKSNFSQTCSLLSQYLKVRGSFGDLNFGMTCDPESKGKSETFCKTPNTERSGQVSDRNATVLKAMDLFPQNSNFDQSISVEDVPKKADFRYETDPKSTQMTIFYAGKVVVFDNFSAEKAQEIMHFARNGSSFSSTSEAEQFNSSNFAASATNLISDFGINSTQESSLQRHLEVNVSDLPIARKASLHRFMAKRKDRIGARAPYQLSNLAAAHAKSEESKTWLGLAPQISLELQI